MKHLGLVALVLAAGCGGGAPVSDSKRVNDLSESERTELCEYWTDQLGPEREIMCGEDIETVGADPGEVGECVASLTIFSMPTCTITVGDLDDCIEAQAEQTDAEACAGDPPACERLEGFEDECFPTDDSGDDGI